MHIIYNVSLNMYLAHANSFTIVGKVAIVCDNNEHMYIYIYIPHIERRQT